MRTWQDNAREFGALSKQGYGVRLAVLAACSVEETGRGSNQHTSLAGSRCSVAAFAREAGVAESTVRSHLAKWDTIAGEWDVERSGLTPEDAETMTVTQGFVEQFDNLPTPGPKGSGTSGKVADIAKNPRALAEAIVASPKAAAAAREGLFRREAKEKHGLDSVPRQRPPDPTPEWKRLYNDWAEATRKLLREIQRLEDAGETRRAATARGYLQESWAEYATRVYPVPDTIEGLVQE